MPTPAGKPKVGEYVVTREGERWLVLRRFPGDHYSVKVRKPDGQEKIITEFEWWMKERGWTLQPASKGR